MKKKFSLEKLLTVRKQKVKRLQGKLFQAKDELEEIKAEMIRLEKEIVESEKTFTLTRRLIEQQQLDLYLQNLREELIGLQNHFLRREKEMIGKQETLARAFQEEKIIENLKKKESAHRLSQLEKEETAFYDEIAQRCSSKL
ncbi:MAG: hypothetical protein KR126chlam2_00269 [Chlamydiae bacterium]|nr:hypothetical protein [Chlamydiota bacterium]